MIILAFLLSKGPSLGIIDVRQGSWHLVVVRHLEVLLVYNDRYIVSLTELVEVIDVRAITVLVPGAGIPHRATFNVSPVIAYVDGLHASIVPLGDLDPVVIR